MSNKPETITIDDVKYVRADSVNQKATDYKGMPYRIVRTQSAGVFAGYVAERDGQEVVLVNARRLWYWEGAASLSQMAQMGVSKPKSCKFAMPVDRVVLLQAIEILDVTKTAQENLETVPIWKS